MRLFGKSTYVKKQFLVACANNESVEYHHPKYVEMSRKRYDEIILNSKEEGVKNEKMAWIHKFKMVLLGIDTFKESERQRGEEVKKGLLRRDGGPTLAAFSFIHKLYTEITNIINEEELKL